MGYGMLLAMLAAVAVQADEVVVRIVEPRPATPWTEVFTARCGRQRLEVSRPIRPLDRGARVRLNGRTVRGDVSALEAELGEARAAYRLSFLCAPLNATMQLMWVSGLAGQDGQVRYRAGSAEFRAGALIRSGAEEATEEAFWYP